MWKKAVLLGALGFALGVAIGAPVLTALTGRMPRKQLLLALMVFFTFKDIMRLFQ